MIKKALRFLGKAVKLLLISLLSFTLLTIGYLKYEEYSTPGLIMTRQVPIVYKKLLLNTVAPQLIPAIYVEYTDVPNAYASKYSLAITKGFLKKLDNVDQLAFIIGHEMGHVLLGHTGSGDTYTLDKPLHTQDSRLREANADIVGLFLMQRAGYNPCNVPGVWLLMYKSYGFRFLTTSHPSAVQRAVYLALPSC